MLLVRPLSVAICTIQSDLNWRQKLFVAWIGPKGIVSASVASLFAIVLTQKGINGGDSIKALVFLTIMMTVFIQGLTAKWVAQWLKITTNEATGAVIVGCNPVGRLLGKLFQQEGELVVMIDTDTEDCQKAEADNLLVFHSRALDANVLQEAGIESMGSFIALTSNGEVNLVLAQRAQEEFDPPRVFAVFPENNSPKISQAFTEEFSIKTWSGYINDGQVKLGKTLFKETELSSQQAHLEALIISGELLPLLLKRDNSLQIVTPSETWQAQDELIFLL